MKEIRNIHKTNEANPSTPKKGEKMNDQSIFDKAAVIAVSVLLILTAWNNAIVMFIVAAIGLAAMLIIFRKKIFQKGALGASVGFVLAIGISLLLMVFH
jgi:hypothetical protein